MKFNDKELGAWATVFAPDKEGLLEKKGAGRGQGYKQRWFRLKGNLLFYFKVDELGGWESFGEPVGVIVLERCRAEKIQHDTRPYSFVLAFENDDSRTYVLSAYSQAELEAWIFAIRMSSYESLKAIYYELTNKINMLTGKPDPHIDQTSRIGASSPTPKRLRDLRRSAYLKVPNDVRARRLNTTDEECPPQFELSLSCQNLPVMETGSPPSTVVRTRCYAEGSTSALSTFSLTELVKSSCSPVYTHLVLVELGPSCPPSGQLMFEVYHLQTEADSENGSEEGWDPTNPGSLETAGKLIGKAECVVSAIITDEEKPLKLHLCQEDGLVCGFLFVKSLKLMIASPKLPRRNALVPLDRGSPAGVLPNIMRAPVRRHFLFTTTRGSEMKVIEEMAESVFNTQVPIELLKCYMREDMLLVNELTTTVGALSDKWIESMQAYQTMLFEGIGVYKYAVTNLEKMADSGEYSFKPSSKRKDPALMFMPTNLHIQRMRVRDGEPERMYNTVTLGCPAHHCGSYKNGGLKKLLWESRSNPSFISRWSEGDATQVKNAMIQISEIQSSIHHYNNVVYMACANASPQDMNDAMIGISSQVQLLLQKMQLPFIMDAIEALIQARPPASTTTAAATPRSTSSGTTTAAAITGTPAEDGERRARAGAGTGERGGKVVGEGEVDTRVSSLYPALSKRWSKRLSQRRSVYGAEGRAGGGGEEDSTSPPPPSPGASRRAPETRRKRCSCGKCSRCVPSPSDWVWNGSKYVQVSTRDWKMSDSLDSIQHCLVQLVDAVEEATTRVVEQQHEAAASSVGYGITSPKPTYVWSEELIPLFSRLRQTLDSLFKVTMSSLAFKLVQLDLYVEGLSILRSRRDDVFSQALTALVTSFYLKLSEYYCHTGFLQQIREIGFLVQFESLLSTYGDESGMLEDMCVAVAELGTVSFQLVPLTENPDLRFDFHVSGTRGALKVQLRFGREYLAVVADEKLQAGRTIPVFPLLVTQGVNEKQSLTNKHEQQLQEDINLQNMDLLANYFQKYEKLTMDLCTAQAKLELEKVKDLYATVQRQHASHRSKNVEFFLCLEELCRRLRGGRLTCCKSGKDRTGMAVTLEECSILRTNHHLLSKTYSTTLSTLRSNGTRLENCFKNTGHRCYNFNTLQLLALPKFLKPPRRTCRDPD